ncbi:hypothetical protein L202_04635 [Cryptococcus amylolentus CBS 6039]|uniref:Zn(2)-C6 fungal-type domain-containing protein n=1 Tax=Cryptococcus amylolentus CBS 6039 TaxID=1295533 RepID=A0A1E3HM81_9TREE|nr:hypothetical protein L202_04635 [Cryptococcus amylolentus CBS 6039]ODN77457.1 hypothetical protein L202_04635 [Cryptococcus amylolentus CBS 6039]
MDMLNGISSPADSYVSLWAQQNANADNTVDDSFNHEEFLHEFLENDPTRLLNLTDNEASFSASLNVVPTTGEMRVAAESAHIDAPPALSLNPQALHNGGVPAAATTDGEWVANAHSEFAPAVETASGNGFAANGFPDNGACIEPRFLQVTPQATISATISANASQPTISFSLIHGQRLNTQSWGPMHAFEASPAQDFGFSTSDEQVQQALLASGGIDNLAFQAMLQMPATALEPAVSAVPAVHPTQPTVTYPVEPTQPDDAYPVEPTQSQNSGNLNSSPVVDQATYLRMILAGTDDRLKLNVMASLVAQDNLSPEMVGLIKAHFEASNNTTTAALPSFVPETRPVFSSASSSQSQSLSPIETIQTPIPTPPKPKRATPKSSSKRKRDSSDEGEKRPSPASHSLPEKGGKVVVQAQRAWNACMECQRRKHRCVKLDADDRTESCSECHQKGIPCTMPSKPRVHPSEKTAEARAEYRARKQAEIAEKAGRVAAGEPATAPKRRKNKKFMTVYKTIRRRVSDSSEGSSGKGKNQEVEDEYYTPESYSTSDDFADFSSLPNTTLDSYCPTTEYPSSSPISDLLDMPMTEEDQNVDLDDLLAACVDSRADLDERGYYPGEAEAGPSSSQVSAIAYYDSDPVEEQCSTEDSSPIEDLGENWKAWLDGEED